MGTDLTDAGEAQLAGIYRTADLPGRLCAEALRDGQPGQVDHRVAALTDEVYLILPKIVSSVVLSPFVMLSSFVIGLFGGAAIIAATGAITMAQYVEGLQFAFKIHYIYYSISKMAVFTFIITSLASYYGYYAKGGSLGVGRSSTKAIVAISVLILVFDLALTKLLL